MTAGDLISILLLCIPWAMLAHGLGTWISGRTAKQSERALTGLTAALGLTVLLLQLAFWGNWFRFTWLCSSVWLLAISSQISVAVWAPKLCGIDTKSRRFRDLGAPIWIPVAIAALALSWAVTSAVLLPVWQWDSLGYHLPFVNFVLQGGGKAELPPDVPYLSTYPRNVELLFALYRSALSTDQLVDLAHLPFGLLAALCTYGIAQKVGAARPYALLAALGWISLPAVFLQLPTNYIDVATGAFFLLAAYHLIGEIRSRDLWLAGAAIGLFLGTKPSAPPQAALLAVLLLFRSWRKKELVLGISAVLLSGMLGLEAYLEQLVRHHNPVWPAIVKLGPIELPGTISVHELLSSGAGAQKVHGALPIRVLKSWTSFDSMPLFDMRVGGISPLFWAALLCLFWALRKGTAHHKAAWLALLSIAFFTPDPAVARYVLPIPALVLALAGTAFAESKPAVACVSAVVSLLTAYNYHYAAPGLVGEGPPLARYITMGQKRREGEVGANGPTHEFVAARDRLAPGEVAVYDRALWLPYLMWRSDLRNRVVRIPDSSPNDYLDSLVAEPKVRLIAAGKDQRIWPIVSQNPERFEKLFECREPCAFFLAH